MRRAHFLNVLLRLLPRWGFSTALNSLQLKHQLSLKPAISGVRANEALCKELRYQCRIDSDDDTEDVMLTLYLNASLKHAEKITNCRLYDNAVPDDDPDGVVIEDDIKLALMLLVSHWYENREPVSSDSVNTIPFGVDAILKQHRKVPGT